MMRTLFLVFAFVLGLAGQPVFGGERISVALYLGKNTEPSRHVALAPEKLTESLHEVFGFKTYELVKAGDIELGKEWEQWVVPRKDFFIRVEPLPHADGEPRLIDYEIYKDGFIVAKGKYEPREGTPLFINGPDFHDGRFIFVLEAR